MSFHLKNICKNKSNIPSGHHPVCVSYISGSKGTVHNQIYTGLYSPPTQLSNICDTDAFAKLKPPQRSEGGRGEVGGITKKRHVTQLLYQFRY